MSYVVVSFQVCGSLYAFPLQYFTLCPLTMFLFFVDINFMSIFILYFVLIFLLIEPIFYCGNCIYY